MNVVIPLSSPTIHTICHSFPTAKKPPKKMPKKKWPKKILENYFFFWILDFQKSKWKSKNRKKN
jgi:hypothetical protein